MTLSLFPSAKKRRALAAVQIFFPAILSILFAGSCSNDQPPMAPALQQRDSLPIMTTYGVSKLISDSGVIRYKVIAEEWKVYDKTNPPKQTFMKGIFMERLDPKFQVDLIMTADTAYWYDQKLWELRGRVYMRRKDGMRFNTDELFWDMDKHELYSRKYMRITTATQQLTGGYGFRSDEQLTRYEFDNASGYFPKPDDAASDTTQVPDDSVYAAQPQMPVAENKSPKRPTR